MTKEELKQRSNTYRQLIDYKPFRALCAEMEEDIEKLKEVVIGYLTDGLTDKALIEAMRIDSIRKVIETPFDAVKESNNLNENS